MSIVEVAAHGDKGMINTPFEILNENLEFDGVDRGVVYMEMKWFYERRSIHKYRFDVRSAVSHDVSRR